MLLVNNTSLPTFIIKVDPLFMEDNNRIFSRTWCEEKKKKKKKNKETFFTVLLIPTRRWRGIVPAPPAFNIYGRDTIPSLWMKLMVIAELSHPKIREQVPCRHTHTQKKHTWKEKLSADDVLTTIKRRKIGRWRSLFIHGPGGGRVRRQQRHFIEWDDRTKAPTDARIDDVQPSED